MLFYKIKKNGIKYIIKVLIVILEIMKKI